MHERYNNGIFPDDSYHLLPMIEKENAHYVHESQIQPSQEQIHLNIKRTAPFYTGSKSVCKFVSYLAPKIVQL